MNGSRFSHLLCMQGAMHKNTQPSTYSRTDCLDHICHLDVSQDFFELDVKVGDQNFLKKYFLSTTTC